MRLDKVVVMATTVTVMMVGVAIVMVGDDGEIWLAIFGDASWLLGSIEMIVSAEAQ